MKSRKIQMIREMLNSKPANDIDLSKWSEDDLRTVVEIGKRNDVKGTFSEANTTPEDLETINKLISKYN